GMCLYYLLTGDEPTRIEQLRTVSHSAALRHMSIRLAKFPMPQELREVIFRAVEENQAARYQSDEAMLKDLEAVYSTSPIKPAREAQVSTPYPLPPEFPDKALLPEDQRRLKEVERRV